MVLDGRMKAIEDGRQNVQQALTWYKYVTQLGEDFDRTKTGLVFICSYVYHRQFLDT